ncbi:TetR family transcriptional regulator [Saccharopolyspora erythraea NRRL 2338]|uniref:TetR-family transcriptional regulator n=2 Tax=Saccharopolyspora erythraea TaxID=1836 RepID=A4FNP7_SACEN|nr:TetR/AcrR family transcriptional regulator [Saccharopolyspora erythraea]EQD82736.1 TetR family transcriptional regulator [Saccharopolyspora erythraea D]PFG99310.1 TetR family transcriptional regulator [Saccharopolyspora erythraea NRRL 2338]QRK89244.1 TetR/AcrR family transcriptional regulator [Saccharopolyspora erythraea]CAM05672.1 putative TetR-family transcriptional regulator [Saccharopolyspora erythraea NRRL 2338]
MTSEERTPAGQRVWETARELFYREGVRSCGVAEIAEHSGVGKPSIYRNFGSKDELAVAYLREKAVPPREILRAAQEAYPGDARAQLRRVVAEIAREITAPGHRGCPLANAVVEFPDRTHPVREAAEALKREYLGLFRELVAPLPVGDPENLAHLIQMLVEGAHITGQIFGPDRSAANLVDATDRLVDSYLSD